MGDDDAAVQQRRLKIEFPREPGRNGRIGAFGRNMFYTRVLGRQFIKATEVYIMLRTSPLLRESMRVAMTARTGGARCFAGMKGIPAGGRAQVLISAVSEHKGGETRGLAQVLFEKGASIAGTKKVLVENNFAMLMSVYTPDEPKALADYMQSPEVINRLGFTVTASLLDPKRPEAKPAVAEAPSESSKRRFKLSCPQQPGIVLALTELLKDYDCKMSSMDADTLARGDEIWFEIEAIVEVPANVDPVKVEAALQFWSSSKDERTKLIFDTFTSNVNGLGAV